MTILRDLSLFWTLSHTLVLFLILFESKYPPKKTLKLSLITMGPLIVFNGAAAVIFEPEMFGILMLLTLTLPSLIFFFIIAKKRDGRFFFTFCMVDTIVLEILYMTQILNHHTTPDTFIVAFVSRLVIFPAMEYFIYKKIRAPYLAVQKQAQHGWWLFAAIGAIFYIIVAVLMNYPSPIVERPEYYLVAFLLFLLMPLIYLHIILTFINQQKTFEKEEQESMLKLQRASLITRIKDFTEANEKYREERHNFRYKLKAVAMLVERKEYEELGILVSDYIDTFKRTAIIRYCDDAVIDAVLAHYISLAESYKIKMDIGFDFPDEIPADASELAIVFANAIDNAIHACEALPEEERRIEIKVISKPKFIIRIKNSFNGTVEFDEDGIPVNREEGHGIGTRSIVAFCNKFDADYHFAADDNTFSLLLNF